MSALKAPGGLSRKWDPYWRRCLKQLQEQGTWTYVQRSLLDEFVLALQEADEAREESRVTDWDRAVKRASSLADQLALTPRGRKAANVVSDDEPEARSIIDELAQRRRAG